ncbi:hypothetical protein LO771_09250 [Streptacidiphilus sp. ASG 303]|uniref:hypothetical protein n=1 Tax=Streptacidiphilus sp. ASG 303 TaxID=2896847 RepID=UPI001E4AC223|nr:hypothetical protein [Streptacidiphilus sp. ASG 303]MCD0482583.1 hypothetical protein [Streptacidiphilus sp. ASG 303]
MSVLRGPLYYARPGGRRLRPAAGRLTVPVSGAAAAVGAAALCLVLAAAGQDRASWLSLALLAGVAAAVGAFSRPWAAPVVAVACWLFYDGFVAHRYGGLGWAGPGVELPRLAVPAAAALLASLPGSLPRRRVRAAVVHLPSSPGGTAARGRARVRG